MTHLNAAQPSIYIAQGEQATGDRPDHLISTILGSCVSVCLTDPTTGIGGMNHILIPESAASDIGARGVGAGAMERLINALLKRGVWKENLSAKVFGGAAVVEGLSDIGSRNAAFVFDYLDAEGIPCLAKSVGGKLARRIQFRPSTGQARQRLIQATEAPKEVLQPKSVSTNDLELF